MNRPGLDPELTAPFAQVKAMMPPLTAERLAQARAMEPPPLEPILRGRASIVTAGGSAGGGLAAGVTLMARDRKDPGVLGQLLPCPMLDHRNATVSSAQYDGDDALWTRAMLHIWAGGLHGFDLIAPAARVSAAARAAGNDWLSRLLLPLPASG